MGQIETTVYKLAKAIWAEPWPLVPPFCPQRPRIGLVIFQWLIQMRAPRGGSATSQKIPAVQYNSNSLQLEDGVGEFILQ